MTYCPFQENLDELLVDTLCSILTLAMTRQLAFVSINEEIAMFINSDEDPMRAFHSNLDIATFDDVAALKEHIYTHFASLLVC
jgi:hypothetical protein